MELPTIFVFTDDAMGDGEDGLTHEPVEQLLLSGDPWLVMLRPWIANEVVEVFRYIIELRHQPAAGVVASTSADIGPRQVCGRVWACARRRTLGDAPRGKPK